MVLFWCVVNIAISFTVARVSFAQVRGLPPGLSGVLTVAVAFHNAVALPLLLVSSLCETAPTLAAEPDCQARTLATCFVYLLPWQCLFWSIGYTVLTRADQDGGAKEGGHPTPTAIRNPLGGATAPAETGIEMAWRNLSEAKPAELEHKQEEESAAVAVQPLPLAVAPAQSLDGDADAVDGACGSRPKSPSGNSDNGESGQPTRAITTPSPSSRSEGVATTLGGLTHRRASGAATAADESSWRALVINICSNPAMIAIPVAMFIGLIDPLRTALFVDKQSVLQPIGSALTTLHDPLLAVATLVTAAR